MARVTTTDGVTLDCVETGAGAPIVFVHEFAGDKRSWEPQLRAFARSHRCIAYDARGYPPSDVPPNVSSYSQARAAEDIRDVMDGFGIERAHVVGCSMGGFATLHFGLLFPERARSLLLCGVGYGAEPDRRERFRAEADAIAARLREGDMAAFAEAYALGPTRVQFRDKDPRGWAEFKAGLAEHSPEGSALTQLGVQKARPSLYDLEAELAALDVPTLIVNGDEDWPCLAPGLYLKRTIPSADLMTIPGTGHACNLEEPDLFNDALRRFLVQVEAGRLRRRDPAAAGESITGMPAGPGA
ncbi:MAG: alpha/beta hydrolase [Paracoccaceae bacterium]